ncbi:MAG: DMT family transporter [Usitatibacter sp.]
MSDRKASIAGVLMVVASAIGFSGKAIIIKLAYRHGVDAVTLLTLRMVFSAPLFLLLAWWATRGPDVRPLAGADLRAIAFLGFLGYYLSSYLDFIGLQYITAALERLILFLNPTIVLLLSAAFLKRRITRRDMLAIALCYAGIALVFGHDFSTMGSNVALGSFWVLLSAITYAIYLIGSGRLVGHVGSIRFACYAGLVSCAAVIVQYLVVRDMSVILSQPVEVYGLTLLMAGVSTVLPIVLMSEGIRRIGASHASIIGSVGPIATIFLGAIFLSEAITAFQLAGAGLVMAGVLAISLQKKPAVVDKPEAGK